MRKTTKKKEPKAEIKIGKIPKILAALTPEQIQNAGRCGYDADTFLTSEGMVDEDLRRITLAFPKWKDNYAIGYAKFLLGLQDKANEFVAAGDSSTAKQMFTSKLNMKERTVDESVEVVVIGAKRAKS